MDKTSSGSFRRTYSAKPGYIRMYTVPADLLLGSSKTPATEDGRLNQATFLVWIPPNNSTIYVEYSMYKIYSPIYTMTQARQTPRFLLSRFSRIVNRQKML